MSKAKAVKVELDDKQLPAPKRIMKAVFATLRSRGYDVMSVEDMETPAHEDLSGGLTPEWASDARKLDNEGVFAHMDVKDELDGVFGEHSGSAPVTAIFVKAGKTVAETVAILDDRGHIGAAINKAYDSLKPDSIDVTNAQARDLKDRATDMVAYKVAEHSKGWVAEKTLTDTDAFSKAGISNDIGEQDAYALEPSEYVQIKSVTLGYKPNQTIKKNEQDRFVTTDNEVPVVFYQWDCDGGLWFGRNHKAVNKQAADVKGHKATTIARTHSAYTYDGRTYRKHWW